MELTNIYEIFIRSFNDSNRDHIGDINGVIEKLDYIKDMGYDGIWLMPIHPSTSYHKYNIDDYYDIDKEYGTLKDFKKLIFEAHKRGIKIIIDLVINHTSHLHPWFLEFIKAHELNDVNNKYYNYYNYSNEIKEGYVKYNKFYYEGRFGAFMPDLNLDNKNVRDEITKIINYWSDLGVDGYRLDAVTSYYTNEEKKNAEFLKFLRLAAKDKYIVGEAWTHQNELKNYYDTNFGSLFSFYLSDVLILSIRMQDVTYLKLYLDNLLTITNRTSLANFISNHDTNRTASLIEAKFPDRIKVAYGVLAMLPGVLYTYYGDEIGMIGEGNDPNRRIGMLWNTIEDLNYCFPPVNTNQVQYVYQGVKAQLEDENSILNYYKKCNHIRLKYRDLMNDEVRLSPLNDHKILEVNYNNHLKIYINFSDRSEELKLNDAYEIVETIDIHGTSTIKDNILKINGYSIVITKS